MKRNVIDGMRLSNKPPPDIMGVGALKSIPIAAINYSLNRFGELYLRGAVDIGIKNDTLHEVRMSSDYLSYTLRLLVQGCDMQHVLKVRISSDREFYRINADYGESLPDENEKARIFAAAKRAGFTITRVRGCVIELLAPVEINAIINLYALSSNEYFCALYRIFFEVQPTDGF